MKRIRRILTEMGPCVGLIYVLAWILESVSGGRARLVVYHLVAQPVRAEPALPARRGRNIVVRELLGAEIYSLPVERPRTVLESRVAQNARCLVATSEGRFLGFLWFVQGKYEEDEVRCRFVPEPLGETSWDFDVFVDPAARMGFTFMRLWDEANRLLSSEGIHWSISRISAYNVGSLASHRRLGLRRIASAVFLCVGPIQLMFATCRPFVHLALRPESRPVVRLRAP